MEQNLPLGSRFGKSLVYDSQEYFRKHSSLLIFHQIAPGDNFILSNVVSYYFFYMLHIVLLAWQSVVCAIYQLR